MLILERLSRKKSLHGQDGNFAKTEGQAQKRKSSNSEDNFRQS